MRDTSVTKILELFGISSATKKVNWERVVKDQHCPFLGKTCFKVRKSDPRISIGTCSVSHGLNHEPVVICPARFLEGRQIFVDCLHLLTTHEPGNKLHIVSEVSIPGGNIDYFLVSAKGGKVRDFVGIEIQTLDTTGTIWPERQKLLMHFGVKLRRKREFASRLFGMNWKMTAKTTLVQMHHKIQTFEHVNKKLVLVIQDRLFDYMAREFRFDHLQSPAVLGDSMHLHVYGFERIDESIRFGLGRRLSTDAQGIATCLGLQAEARIEVEQILKALEAKISPDNLFVPV